MPTTRKPVSATAAARPWCAPALSSSARRSLGPSLTAFLSGALARPVEFMPAPELTRANAEQSLFTNAPAIRRPQVDWFCTLMHDDRTPPKPSDSLILTMAQERVIFLQLNYARSRLAKLQQQRAAKELSVREAREALRWARTAAILREQIAEINLGLVLAMARRVRNADVEFADLISEGNMALLRAIDKFDCTRGFKFSTYGCRAILKAYSRHGIKQTKYRQRFPTEYDPDLERSDFHESSRAQHAMECAGELGFVLESNAADLTLIEREVIAHRFGVNAPISSALPTLEQIGSALGVTKERVRQIQVRALEKLRAAFMERLEARPRAVATTTESPRTITRN